MPEMTLGRLYGLAKRSLPPGWGMRLIFNQDGCELTLINPVGWGKCLYPDPANLEERVLDLINQARYEAGLLAVNVRGGQENQPLSGDQPGERLA